MEQEKNIWDFLVDRGGRRLIKDRRFWVASKQIPERRTGLKRRSGFDRRYNQVQIPDRENRRMGYEKTHF